MLGHSFGSRKLAHSTYHTADREIDIVALRFNTEANTTLTKYHSSVAYDAERQGHAAVKPLSSANVMKDPVMHELVQVWANAEESVKAIHGNYSIDLDLLSVSSQARLHIIHEWLSLIFCIRWSSMNLFK